MPRRLLAVETATQHLGVALYEGARLLAQRHKRNPRGHAEHLLPAITAVLREANCAPAELDAYALSVGPGSFSGLRVGAATLKGLAFGERPPYLSTAEAPVAPVPTLAALAAGAEGAGVEGPVAALLDARRGEVYAGVWPRAGALEAQVAESVFSPEALAVAVPQKAALVCGEGADTACEKLLALRPDLRRLPAPIGVARAEPVARLGARMLAAGGGISAAELAPRYVRRAEAEVQRTGLALESAPANSKT